MEEKSSSNQNFIHEMYPVHIQKRNNETSKQFHFRKRIFGQIFNELKDQEKSLIYSNIWVNILSLGCTYPKEIMDKVNKYKPSESENVF